MFNHACLWLSAVHITAFVSTADERQDNVNISDFPARMLSWRVCCVLSCADHGVIGTADQCSEQ